jgi:hypothetical protein
MGVNGRGCELQMRSTAVRFMRSVVKGNVRDARPNGSRTGDREMNGGGLNLGGMLKCVRKGIAMGME